MNVSLRWLSVGLALLLLGRATTFSNEVQRFNGRAMGTTYSIQVLPKTAALPAGLSGEIEALLEKLEQQMSTFRADSEVSRFNAHAGTNWFVVSPEVAQVVSEARRISEMTAGAFDVTADPLVRLWGFGPHRGIERVPSEQEIAATRQLVNFRTLEVQLAPPAVRKLEPRQSIDLSGVAKGYAVDALAGLLERHGLTNYLVGLAGEQRARGLGPAGRPWRIGIEAPGAKGRLEAVIELADGSVSTSGDYRNFTEIAGRRYSHLIDPRTGRPVTNGLASVSVVHPSSLWADALATALFVLGPEEGYELARREKLGCLFVWRGADGFQTRATAAYEKLRVR